MGYKNHGHFLQFAFWGSLWITLVDGFVLLGAREVRFTNWDYIFYVSSSTILFFGWAVFFMYIVMALKGLTVIEAAQKFSIR